MVTDQCRSTTEHGIDTVPFSQKVFGRFCRIILDIIGNYNALKRVVGTNQRVLFEWSAEPNIMRQL